MENIFIFIIYFFPFCSSMSRLWLFSKYFTFDLWHYYPSTALLDDQGTPSIDTLPFLLQSNPTFKAQMVRHHRLGFLFLLILSAAFNGLAIWDAIEGDDTEAMTLKVAHYNMAHILVHSVQFIFGGLPDVVMICVVRLQFIHCSLYIAAFERDVDKITAPSATNGGALDDVLKLEVYGKYLIMHREISSFCRRAGYFIASFVLAVSFIYWFVITLVFRLWFFTDWTASGHSGISIMSSFPAAVQTPLYLQFTVFAIQGLFAVLFMLWPAFGMNQRFGGLKERINGQVEVLLEHRTYLHDERVLKGMTTNDLNGPQAVSELHSLMEVYSKQKSCLEMLFQTRLAMMEKPCTFKLFGCFPLSRGIFRDFALVLLLVKVVLFLWYGIN